MSMHAFHLHYGRRIADKVAEQDRREAKERNCLAASFHAESTPKTTDPEPLNAAEAISISDEWRRAKRGEIDFATALRLIKGREERELMQRQQATKTTP